jgi:arylsulfatase A
MKKTISTLLIIPFTFVGGLSAETIKPNIIVIYTDDQGYGDASSYNSESKFQTPHIDRLAKEGMRFTDGHSSATICSPSRYGLLTGRYSWRTTRKKGNAPVDGACWIAKDRLTLASLLQKKGYNTGMSGKWHLGMDFPGTKGKRIGWDKDIVDGPNAKGFDYYFGIPASMNYGVLTYIENKRVLEEPSLWTHKKPSEAIDDFRFMPPYDAKPKKKGDIEIAPSFLDENALTEFTNKALAWLETVKKDAQQGKPFFLYMPLSSPHKPVVPKKEFVGKSKAGLYGDFMIETDHHVGSILKFLDDNNLTKNTMVVFTSDNGQERTYSVRAEKYNHHSGGGLRGGKRDLYEGGHRVPFIIRWPNAIKAGSVTNETVCQTDLLATFADIVGTPLKDNEGEDSFSLKPIFSSKAFNRAPVIHHSVDGAYAIREGDWKLSMKRRKEPKQLVNLKDDLKEENNLLDKNPAKVKELTEKMATIILNGGSKPNKKTSNDGPKSWAGIKWISKQ